MKLGVVRFSQSSKNLPCCVRPSGWRTYHFCRKKTEKEARAVQIYHTYWRKPETKNCHHLMLGRSIMIHMISCGVLTLLVSLALIRVQELLIMAPQACRHFSPAQLISCSAQEVTQSPCKLTLFLNKKIKNKFLYFFLVFFEK